MFTKEQNDIIHHSKPYIVHTASTDVDISDGLNPVLLKTLHEIVNNSVDHFGMCEYTIDEVKNVVAGIMTGTRYGTIGKEAELAALLSSIADVTMDNAFGTNCNKRFIRKQEENGITVDNIGYFKASLSETSITITMYLGDNQNKSVELVSDHSIVV